VVGCQRRENPSYQNELRHVVENGIACCSCRGPEDFVSGRKAPIVDLLPDINPPKRHSSQINAGLAGQGRVCLSLISKVLWKASAKLACVRISVLLRLPYWKLFHQTHPTFQRTS
jgi:hypothetical protein